MWPTAVFDKIMQVILIQRNIYL